MPSVYVIRTSGREQTDGAEVTGETVARIIHCAVRNFSCSGKKRAFPTTQIQARWT